MYAHQVIEDLSATMEKTDDSDVSKTYSEVINGITQAQKFHLGEWSDFRWMFENFKEKRLFFDPELSDFVKLPYDLCWFDFTNNIKDQEIKQGTVEIKKRGMLVRSILDDVFLMHIVNYVDHVKKWVISPLAYAFYIGGNFEVYSFYTLVGKEVSLSFKKEAALLSRNGKKNNILPIPNFDINKMLSITGGDTRSLIKTCIKDDKEDFACLNATLMLLNCKNIGANTNEAPLKLNQKRLKKGKQPLFTYKTLVIKPTGKQQKSVPKHLWDNRIHLCRGHFKTYTEDAPLFGKYTGRYWWQPSVRGNKNKGVVMKDYKLEAVGHA